MSFEEIVVVSKTWGLIYMLILFAGVLVYALRPSAKRKFEEAAQIPLRED